MGSPEIRRCLCQDSAAVSLQGPPGARKGLFSCPHDHRTTQAWNGCVAEEIHDTAFLEGITKAVIEVGPGTNEGGLHLDWGGRRGVEEGCMRQLAQVFKAGWEVTHGERGESPKDSKGGRSSLSKGGNCTERGHHHRCGDPADVEPLGGLGPEGYRPSLISEMLQQLHWKGGTQLLLT